jgi:hypothetical protein
MRRLIAALLLCSLVAPLAAVGSRKAEYVGGTIAGLPERTEGLLDTTDATTMRFTPEKRGLSSVAVPYARITSLEYGQKAGRRVGVAILISPLALFSKKRKHFMTVGYTDAAGKEQALVLELGKDITRTTLTVVETRAGQAIEYQDDEAKKAGRGGN